LKLRINVCPALQLAKRGHKVVFTCRAMRGSVFGKESACVFGAIRARILA